MKDKFILLTIGILLPLLSSCVFDDEDIVPEQDSVMVTFSVDVKAPSATRADANTWGDNTDDDQTNDYPEVVGNSLENRVDLSTLHVLAYHSDFSFAKELPILARQEVDGKATFVCGMPKSMPFEARKVYRFILIANSTNNNYSYGYKDDAPNLGSLIYSNIQSTIPMWGIKTYTFPDEKPSDNLLRMGSVSMLRATAKIGVKLSPEVKSEGYSLKEIKLNYANACGYCVPTDWNHADTYFTESLMHDQAFRPNTAAGLATGINAMAYGTSTDGYYIYVPETANDSADQLALAVTLTDGNGGEVEFEYENGIKFEEYSEGVPSGNIFNIVRNHFYDYTITEVNAGMKINLDVADWEAEDVWELDFSAPVHTMLLTAPKDNAPAPADAPTVSYNNLNDEKDAFVGYFKMISPAGVSWKPTLTNASAADYEVRVYTNGSVTPDVYDIPVSDVAIEAADNRFFKIVVVAKNPDMKGKVVKLGISYTASWNDENTLLMINGDNNGLYWPWVDNEATDDKDDPDAHWISIIQQ